MEDSAFDEFLQTPIMGRWKPDAEAGTPGEEDLEERKVRVNIASHQAFSRGDGAASATSLREASYGGGQSQQLQLEVVWGYCLLQGLAVRSMEDLHVAEVRNIDGEEKNLFENILNEGGVWSDPTGATRDAYLLTDRNILDSDVEKGGCTAVTAMVCGNGRRLIVANLGDSRAVLCKNGKAVQISVDHDPGRPSERANVEARGGPVTHLPGDQWRVDGQLALARVFGDKGLKEHMSAKPDVSDLVIDLSCEFLVLGSNGLFSMLDNQEVVDRVKDSNDPVKAAHNLVLEARRRLSEDDISCIVIMFQEL